MSYLQELVRHGNKNELSTSVDSEVTEEREIVRGRVDHLLT